MEYIYASLLLREAKKDINEENIRKVLEAAGVKVDEVRVKALVAALKEIDIDKVLESAMVPLAAPMAATPTAAPAEEEKEEEAKEEEEEKEELTEEDLASGLGALFG
ncbi:MAG: 50S ribosomal protein P1 [Desulfurococcales archaeon]|nr:50S ribosomal protein P1 [Desulfurococcales archaeon]